MDIIAVTIAAFFQIMGYAFFLVQPRDCCSPAPILGSWLFLLATLRFLWDVSIIPTRFIHCNRVWQVVVETVGTIFVTEVATIVIWCGIERFLYGLAEDFLGKSCSGCDPSPHVYWVSGLVTSLAGGSFLWYILEVTDST
ncbi:hypothetical protein KR074_012648, partial [Drosophila pseudoananassae]